MSSLLEDPMVLREIIMDHYQYPHNHKLTDDAGYHQVHMAGDHHRRYYGSIQNQS